MSAKECKQDIGQAEGIQYITLVVCSISVLSSLLVFCSYIIYRRETKRFHSTNLRMKLLLYMNMFGMVYSCSLFTQALLVAAKVKGLYSYPFCQIQAFITNWASLALNTWSLCFTIYLYLSLMSQRKYQDLKRLLSRVEKVFVVWTWLIIPIPFLIMIFPLPLAHTDRKVLLFGESSKYWCDFANTHVKKSPTSGSNIESYWAIYWESGFVYAPNTLMFLISLTLYTLIMFRVKRNANEVKKQAEQLKHQNDKEKNSQEDISALLPDDTKDNQESKHLNINLGHIHTPLSLADYEGYQTFLKLQARTASIYVLVFSVNWLVWLVARFVWEFVPCSYNDNSRFVLKVCIVILEICGPRIDCLLLSIIYGLAENTIIPSRFEDFVTNSFTVPFLKEYCATNRGYEEVQPSIVRRVGLFFRRSTPTEVDERSGLLPIEDRVPPATPPPISVTETLDSEAILYFWYDYHKLSEAIYHHAEYIEKFFHLIVSPTLNADRKLAQTLLKVDEYSSKITKYSRDIYYVYFNQNALLPLHDLMPARDRQKLEHFVKHFLSDPRNSSTDVLKSIIKNDSHEDLTLHDTYIEAEERDFEEEFGRTLVYANNIQQVLARPEKIAHSHLKLKIQGLLSSHKFEEIQSVLRIKSHTTSRSIYRDLINRINRAIRKLGSTIKAIFVRLTTKSSVQSPTDAGSEVKPRSQMRFIDPAIYSYLKNERRIKLQAVLDSQSKF